MTCAEVGPAPEAFDVAFAGCIVGAAAAAVDAGETHHVVVLLHQQPLQAGNVGLPLYSATHGDRKIVVRGIKESPCTCLSARYATVCCVTLH